jgi:hypothetical protein
MTHRPALVLDAERDRLGLLRLRAAVRADFGRSAMIYAASDLAAWIVRAMDGRGRRAVVTAAGEGIVVEESDPEALAAIERATISGSFDPP